MDIFQWLSIGTGLLATIFWVWSACVRFPTSLTSGWGPVGGMQRFQVLADKLNAQGRISALAAVTTAFSVFCLAIVQMLAQLG